MALYHVLVTSRLCYLEDPVSSAVLLAGASLPEQDAFQKLFTAVQVAYKVIH